MNAVWSTVTESPLLRSSPPSSPRVEEEGARGMVRGQPPPSSPRVEEEGG